MPTTICRCMVFAVLLLAAGCRNSGAREHSASGYSATAQGESGTSLRAQPRNDDGHAQVDHNYQQDLDTLYAIATALRKEEAYLDLRYGACPGCEGTGKTRNQDPSRPLLVTCNVCHGTGHVLDLQELDDFILHVGLAPVLARTPTSPLLEKLRQKANDIPEFAAVVRQVSVAAGMSLNPQVLESQRMKLVAQIVYVLTSHMREFNRHALEACRRDHGYVALITGTIEDVLNDADQCAVVVNVVASGQNDDATDTGWFIVCVRRGSDLSWLCELRRHDWVTLLSVSSKGALDCIAKALPGLIDRMQVAEWQDDAYGRLVKALRQNREQPQWELVRLIYASGVPIVRAPGFLPYLDDLLREAGIPATPASGDAKR